MTVALPTPPWRQTLPRSCSRCDLREQHPATSPGGSGGPDGGVYRTGPRRETTFGGSRNITTGSESTRRSATSHRTRRGSAATNGWTSRHRKQASGPKGPHQNPTSPQRMRRPHVRTHRTNQGNPQGHLTRPDRRRIEINASSMSHYHSKGMILQYCTHDQCQ